MTRRRQRKPSRREQAVQAWLERSMADPAAARLATHITLMHTGLITWAAAAEQATVLPDPFRLPGDERAGGVAVGGNIRVSREPDDRMLTLVADRLDHDGHYDPERLEPVRQYLTHRLGQLAGWYLDQTGTVLLERWEPRAVRLGDLIGDQTAANHLATSVLGHHHLAITTPTLARGVCQTGRERWRRLAIVALAAVAGAGVVTLLDQLLELPGRLPDAVSSGTWLASTRSKRFRLRPCWTCRTCFRGGSPEPTFARPQESSARGLISRSAV